MRAIEQADLLDNSLQDQINRRVYHAEGVAEHYLHNGLDAAEAVAFLTYLSAITERDVLDLGIGTGRTTRILSPLVRSYVGTDYSPLMVDHSRRLFPEADIRLLDMRDLSKLGNQSFDCVIAICNLLDAVSHSERIKTLEEIQRVLRPGGLFFFSSHNLAFRNAGAGPQFGMTPNPIRFVRNAVKFFRQFRNYRRLKKYCGHRSQFSIFTDMGHDFSVLHYYIDLTTQETQLSETGFLLVDAFDRLGRRLEFGSDAVDTGDILYVARSV